MNFLLHNFPYMKTLKILNQSRTFVSGRIVYRRKHIFPAIRTMRIVASTASFIHQQISGVAGVSALSVHPGARRRGLERRVGRPLVEPVSEGVGGGSG